MQFSTSLATFAFLLLPLASATLKLPPLSVLSVASTLKQPTAPAHKAPATPLPLAAKGNATVSAADGKKLWKKLKAVSLNLEGVLKEQSGNSKLASVLTPFLTELKTALDATASAPDTPEAMQQLKAAQAGMAMVGMALTKQQSDLMHENQMQATSLLLGVLMTRRSEPMEKQLEVLKSPDFKDLPVAAELLTTKDKQTPLFQQVAAYMDKHGGKQDRNAATEKADRLSKSIAYFSKRVEELKKEQTRLKEAHQRAVSISQAHKSSSSTEMAHKFALMEQHEKHEYEKHMATLTQQTMMMEKVVNAMKRGDTKALKAAEAALEAHLKTMKERSGGFLYLLQLSHQLMGKDCPYCAAQCIDKCHSAGNPYTQCLTTCADAGK